MEELMKRNEGMKRDCVELNLRRKKGLRKDLGLA